MSYNGAPYPITQLTPEQMDRIRVSVTTAKANEERDLVEAAKQFEEKQRRQRLRAKIRRLSRDLDKEVAILEKM